MINSGQKHGALLLLGFLTWKSPAEHFKIAAPGREPERNKHEKDKKPNTKVIYCL